ncbi:kinetochore Sim4 complex subunit Fta4 [Rhexocercosporidium sp. MPI-PUGE-AT-0058]|nr:kinetochore Sim4 complex subunit Fta4 [Rhexocercosporidium sp. MPI-PUGE-AT-0058]
MSSSTPTILDLKTTFLRTQILSLSQPLRASSTFTASNTSDEENALRQKAIDDALLKLNNQLKQHNRLAYGPQAQRHVAEQVDRLYWNAGEKGLRILGGDDGWAERGADYRKESVIEQLPDEWSENASTKSPDQAAKFTELTQKLTALNEQRRVARERVERYRRFKEMVGFLGEDAGVQDNLVTRNGEVEVELEKMRRLMLRVERGVGALEGRGVGDGEEMDVDVDFDVEGKILALLSGDV